MKIEEFKKLNADIDTGKEAHWIIINYLDLFSRNSYLLSLKRDKDYDSVCFLDILTLKNFFPDNPTRFTIKGNQIEVIFCPDGRDTEDDREYKAYPVSIFELTKEDHSILLENEFDLMLARIKRQEEKVVEGASRQIAEQKTARIEKLKKELEELES